MTPTTTERPDKGQAINWKRWAVYCGYTILLIVLVAWLGPILVDRPAYRIVQTTIAGLLVGGVYALIALGIVVINKSSGVFNFAQGGMMMVGGFVFFSFFTVSDVSFKGALTITAALVVMIITMTGWRHILDPKTAVLGITAAILMAVPLTISAGNYPWLEDILPGVYDWLVESARTVRWVRAFSGAIAGTVLLGLAIERFTIRPLIGQPLFTAILMTLALSEVLNGFTLLIWGSQPNALMVFAETNVLGMEQRLGAIRLAETSFLGIDVNAVDLLGGQVSIEQPRLYAFGLSAIAFVAFWLFFRFTSVGLAMRATSEDQQLAQSVGLRVRVILAVAWGVAALLAGIAGTLHCGAAQLDVNMQYLALRVFPAVLLGGLESVEGAFVGGLVIGLTEEYAKLMFSGDVGEQLAPYVVLMIVLVIRPDGLFGQKRIERI